MPLGQDAPATRESGQDAPATGESGQDAPATGESGQDAPATGESGQDAPATGLGCAAPYNNAIEENFQAGFDEDKGYLW